MLTPHTPLHSQMLLLGCGSSGSGESYTPPLDAVSSKLLAAYACHRLITGVSDGVRVRESAGSTEQDVGTLVTGDFDGDSFTTFINGGTGYAAKWYDQVAANDLIQATAADQPSIDLTTIGGVPGLDVQSSNAMHTAAFANTIGTGDFEFWCVFRHAFAGSTGCFSALGSYSPGFYYISSGTIKPTFWDGGAFRNFNTTLTSGADYLIRFFRVSGTMFCAINGATEASSYAHAADISGTKALHVCSESAGSAAPFVGQMAACLWFKEGLTSGEASALTTALKTYFGIA